MLIPESAGDGNPPGSGPTIGTSSSTWNTNPASTDPETDPRTPSIRTRAEKRDVTIRSARTAAPNTPDTMFISEWPTRPSNDASSSHTGPEAPCRSIPNSPGN